MKKLLVLIAVVLAANSAHALDIASLANKVQSAADKANAKIEEAQTKQETEKAKSISKIEEKIAVLKEKIAKWQSSDSADTEKTKTAIADAKASIEKLLAQLKALRGE